MEYRRLSTYVTAGLTYAPSMEASPCTGVWGTRSPAAVVYPQLANGTNAPVADDCLWTGWSAWSACMVAIKVSLRDSVVKGSVEKWQATDARAICGDAIRYQTRTLLKGSDYCTFTYQEEMCSLPPCSRTVTPTTKHRQCVLSGWSDWTQCTRPCGTGTQARSRVVQVEPSAGLPCDGELVQSRECNAVPCPLDLLRLIDNPAQLSVRCGANVSLRYLSASLLATSLAAMLAGPGPFVIFAPTDAAFVGLGAGLRGNMSSVLKYAHDIANKPPFWDLMMQCVAFALLQVQRRSGIT